MSPIPKYLSCLSVDIISMFYEHACLAYHMHTLIPSFENAPVLEHKPDLNIISALSPFSCFYFNLLLQLLVWCFIIQNKVNSSKIWN